MRSKASVVAITLIGAFVLAVLAGILPMGSLSLGNSGNAEASSHESRLLNKDSGASPQTEVASLEATKVYVNDAIAAYREDPEKALAYYRSEKSIVSDPPGLYLLLLDGDTIKANATFRGAEGLSISWREDPLGNRYGAKLTAADEDGAVVEYLLPIPSQDYTFRKKTAWAIRASVPDIDNPGEMEDLVFSAGWLDLEGEVESTFTEAQKAVAAVIEARARMQVEVTVPTVGTAVPTFNYYKSPDSIDGEIYVWLAFPTGLILADATMPELVGQNTADVYPDVGEDMLAVQPQQARWVKHMWTNPQTNQVELKHSYVTNFIGFYVVSGYYDETPPVSLPSPTPTATPTPDPDCFETIDVPSTVDGTWDDTCVSEHTTRHGITEGRYARFYIMILEETSDVTLYLTGDEDSYLYLMRGVRKSGMEVDERGAAPGNVVDAQIVANGLEPGTYTIEATTYYAQESGTFTLSVTVGTSDAIPTPTPEPTPEPTPPTPEPTPSVRYTEISSGANHVCAIATDGSIMCWGSDDFGQVSRRPQSGVFTHLSSGDNHTCALRNDGEVVCWGSIMWPGSLLLQSTD